MCGRYSFRQIDKFFERYAITRPVLILDPRDNVAPGVDMPVVYRMGRYQVAEEMNWGFIPLWNKDRFPSAPRGIPIAEPNNRDQVDHERRTSA